MKKLKFRKSLSLALAVAMVLSLVPNSLPTYAAEADISIEETQESDEPAAEDVVEETTEASEVGIPTVEETTEAPAGEPSESVEETTEETTEESFEEPVEETSEEGTEETTEETTEEPEVIYEEAELVPTFDHLYEGVDVSGKDFSSCELLIAGDSSVFTADTEVVSEYDGIYLTRYPDAETTMYAYSYYFTRMSLVLVNSSSFKAADEADVIGDNSEEASEDDGDVPQQSEEGSDENVVVVPAEPLPNDGHGEADLSEINTGDDAFSIINNLPSANYSGYIALIDSGASSSVVKASVSVLGGGAGDDNGHGTKIANKIAEINPNANVLSIKALDSSGRAQASDVYAAIQYAIDCRVSIINLSISSVNTSESRIVKDAINEAIANGITVVGAAGNYGSDASYFIPGCVGGVITCTATDENGIRLSNANYGSAVDYYVVAGSTSEAAAIVSGFISRDGLGFSSDLVRTKEGFIEEASEGDAEEVETEEVNTEPETSEEDEEKYNNDTKIKELIITNNPWLEPGVFIGQLSAGQEAVDAILRNGSPEAVWSTELNAALSAQGLPDHFSATFHFTQNNAYGRPFSATMGGLTNISSDAVYEAYMATGSSMDCFCNCSDRGHRPNGCADPGNAGDTFAANTSFYAFTVTEGYIYYVAVPVNMNGQSHANGYQQISYIVRMKGEGSQPGYVTVHKQALNSSGGIILSSARRSTAGIVYGLYDDEHPDSTGNTLIARFTLGADGYPSSISVVTQRAGSGDKAVTHDGHLALQWYSTINQNWYFKEISVNGNYLLNSGKTSVSYSPGTSRDATVSDYAKWAYIRVRKTSADADYSENLAGAEFKVFTTQAAAQNAANTGNYSGAIGTLTSGSNGYTNTMDVTSYMDATSKTFYVVESKAPSTYHVNHTVTPVTATVGTTETAPITVTISEYIKVHLALKKVSSNTDCTDGNVNYDLAGARYRIFESYNDAKAAIDSGDFSGALKNSDGDFLNLVTDSNGNSNKICMDDFMTINSDGSVRAKQFFVAEYRVPKNYRKNTTPTAVTVNSTHDINHPATAQVSDVPVSDPVRIQIVKKYKNGNQVPLQDAEFTVNFFDQDIEQNYNFDQLEAMNADWTETFTSDANGEILITYENGTDFPLGYITIEETTAPDGFKIDGSVATLNGVDISPKMAVVFTSDGSATTGYSAAGSYIVNDDNTRGECVSDGVASISNPITVGEVEISGELEVYKENGNTGEPVESIEFEIKNTDTDETHTFKTDANGYYSTESSYISHSAAGGVWFVNGPQGVTRDTVDDNVGALVAGHYTLSEINSLTLQKEEPIDFEITTDGQLVTACDLGRGDGLKIISNMEMPKLGTLALAELFANGSSPSDDEYENIMRNFTGVDSLPDGVHKVLYATDNQKVTDICHYENLLYGTDYTLYGRLMQINEDGSVEPFVNNGAEVTGITNFRTADTYEKSRYEANGYATVRFDGLDFTGREEQSFVVFEYLYLGTLTEDDINDENFDTHYNAYNDTVEFPLVHADATDEYQTLTVSGGGTEAKSYDETKTVSVMNKHFVIYDTCHYTNLIKGHEYTISGYIYERPINDPEDKEYTDEELEALKAKDKDGNYITGSTTFTAPDANGDVVVKFEFDMDYEVQKKLYVVGEDCEDESLGGIKAFTHLNLHDKWQSFYEPVISTQAKGTEGRSELCYNEGKFIDTINYENLEANATYTVEGVAMDKKTGKELMLNGKPVKATATFKTGDATNPNGAVDGSYDLEFIITEDQFEDVQGKTMVIFETLKNEAGTLIAEHKDIDDKDQELTVSKLETELMGEDTKDHITYPSEKCTLVDTCKYENLIGGKIYTIHGCLMDQQKNEPLLDENGKKIESSVEFTADASGSGVVEVTFTFNASLLEIKGESIVAFEDVTPQGYKKPVSVHFDIDDDSQTVDICKVGTKVSKSSWTSKETISLTDSISYKNLMVKDGYKYIAKGWLVDEKGNKVTVDGKEIYKEVEFTPTSKDGMIDVKFDDFSAAGLSGKYVVYEEVYVVVPEHKDADGKTISTSTHLVGEHKDLTDSNQTITVTNTPKTGMTMFFILLGIIVAAGAGMILSRKKVTEEVTEEISE